MFTRTHSFQSRLMALITTGVAVVASALVAAGPAPAATSTRTLTQNAPVVPCNIRIAGDTSQPRLSLVVPARVKAGVPFTVRYSAAVAARLRAGDWMVMVDRRVRLQPVWGPVTARLMPVLFSHEHQKTIAGAFKATLKTPGRVVLQLYGGSTYSGGASGLYFGSMACVRVTVR